VGDPRAHLLSQDLIYVGGGSLVSLLGTWRAHGLDEILFEAWEAGVVLCGGSAGALCWFRNALSGFHEGPPRTIAAMGMLPWSCAVHYTEEQGRRESYLDAVTAGMQEGFGIGDSAALHFIGGEMAEVVSSRPQARAAFVSRGADGLASEHPLPVRYLGDAVVAELEGTALAA
ncbi:MAG TPA: Type 1 glutamine amidotransferase-like domain-containing protein, partial [Solirubrobacteraceae bacterium]|nr:Type 1 glutamine amidotransferase-like domain-containing protein [Solirubrobacteraceae bacterium]